MSRTGWIVTGIVAGLPVLVALGPAPAAQADEAAKHLLRYKMRAGEVLRWDVDQRSSVRNTIEATTQEAETKTLSRKAWKIVDATPDGAIELLNLVEWVQMENRLPDRAPMRFDSDKDRDAPPGFEDAADAVGKPLSLVKISPRGEVLDRSVKHHQPAADPHEAIVLLLPEGPIAVGESWTQPQDVTIKAASGGTRVVAARRRHTLESVENGVATIQTEFQVLSPTNAEADAQLAHRMATGTIRFDIERGRVLSQRLDVDRRVLAFAGPSSSMHLVSRVEEKLRDAAPEVASRN